MKFSTVTLINVMYAHSVSNIFVIKENAEVIMRELKSSGRGKQWKLNEKENMKEPCDM